jgi:hypothetical protein
LVIGLTLAGDARESTLGEWLFGKSSIEAPRDRSVRPGVSLLAFLLPLAAWAAARRRHSQTLPGAALFGRELSPKLALRMTAGLERAAGVVIAIDRRIERVFGVPAVEPDPEPEQPSEPVDLTQTVPAVPKAKTEKKRNKGRAS